MSDKSTSHYLRKLADRIHTITVSLNDSEVDESKLEVCRLLDEEDALKEKLKSIKSEFKAKADSIKQRTAVARGKVTARQASVEVAVQDWLTKSNEVITIRPDTGEILPGSRTATASELQEPMDLQDEDDGFGSGGSH